MIREVLILVWVNGKQLDPALSRQVESLTFDFPKNKATSGSMTIIDNDMSIIDADIFKQNNRIGFMCGWKTELLPVGPFIIKNSHPSFPEDGKVTLKLDFQDKSHKLNKKEKRKRWYGKPDSIIRRIAKNQGLDTRIDPIEGVEFTEDFPLIQANMTDAALIQKIALRYGYIWGVYGDNLVFRRPTDLEESGIQTSSEVPVLHYRQSDFSISSFTPDIKFSKGGKRKNKKQIGSNIDLKDLKSLAEDQGVDINSLLPEEGAEMLEGVTGNFDIGSDISNVAEQLPNAVQDMFGLKSGQEPSAEDAKREGKKDEEPTWRLNEISGQLGLPSLSDIFGGKTKENDEDNEESKPGDPSGGAAAENKSDAEKKSASKIVRASQTVVGQMKPTIASMYYRPRMAIVLAGLGQRLSGKYEVMSVSQSLSGSTDIFDTTTKMMKRKYFPAPKDKQKIGASDEGTPKPGDSDTSKGKPAENLWYLKEIEGKLEERANIGSLSSGAVNASAVHRAIPLPDEDEI